MHASVSEILVILLVALLVIKPEHLPDAAFTLGRWIKQLKQMVTHIQQEIGEGLVERRSEQEHEQK